MHGQQNVKLTFTVACYIYPHIFIKAVILIYGKMDHRTTERIFQNRHCWKVYDLECMVISSALFKYC